MKNIELSWTLPTTRASGNPIDPATIAGVELAFSTDGGLQYTVDKLYPPSELKALFTDVADGDWYFRGVVIDTSGRRSEEYIIVVAVVPTDDSPPGKLVTFTAVLL